MSSYLISIIMHKVFLKLQILIIFGWMKITNELTILLIENLASTSTRETLFILEKWWNSDDK